MKNNKTIGFTVRFFTNGLPEKIGDKNDKIPMWSSGFVCSEANKQKGLKAMNKAIRDINEIPEAIEYLMKKARIVKVK